MRSDFQLYVLNFSPMPYRTYPDGETYIDVLMQADGLILTVPINVWYKTSLKFRGYGKIIEIPMSLALFYALSPKFYKLHHLEGKGSAYVRGRRNDKNFVWKV